MLLTGPQELSAVELIAVLLGSGVQGHTVHEAAQALLELVQGDLSVLFSIPPLGMTEVPGIGRAVQGRFHTAGFHSLEAVQAYVHSLQEMALHVGVPPRAYVISWLGSILHGIAVPVIMRVQRAVLP